MSSGGNPFRMPFGPCGGFPRTSSPRGHFSVGNVSEPGGAPCPEFTMKASTCILFASLAALADMAAALPPSLERRTANDGVRVVTVTVPSAPSQPTPAAPYNWREGSVDEYPIHASCNGTERAQLRRALDETVELAQHARDHILRFGRSSGIYARYFGNASTGEPIGWFERLARGDKGGMWFRCDDVDGNCHQAGWGGHWRGANASAETVICPLSYETRKPLDALCSFGYTVAAGKLNLYWAADLMHRIFHLEPVGEGAVEHYADSHAECLAIAKSDPSKAVRNTYSLQYFALDAYAYDVVMPGEGCPGRSSSASSSAPAPAQPPATTTAAVSPTKTSTAGAECHTHSDGVVHCV
ncbi:hypothetical protein RB594_008488 [Gaeumannomyces avenae]